MKIERGTFNTNVATTVTRLEDAGTWLRENLSTTRGVFQSGTRIFEDVGGDVVSVERAPNAPAGMEFNATANAVELRSRLATYLLQTQGLSPAAGHRVRLTLHEHRPTFTFNVGFFSSQSQTWVDVELVETTDDYDGGHIISSVDVSVGSSQATALVQVVPHEADVAVEWGVTGTDGFQASGTVTTNAQGRASFTIPVGAGGVRDIATISLPVSGQELTESWIY